MSILFALALTASALLAQGYTAAPTGAPPEQVAGPIREALQSAGVKVVDPNGFTFCEVWFQIASLEEALLSGSIPAGGLVGVIRYASPGADRRGQGFAPGLYTLRFSQGDSVLLVRASDDQELNSPEAEDLAALSRKVSRTGTPAALRLARGASGRLPRLEMTRGGEWILHTRLGETPVSLLVVGVTPR